MQAAVLDAVQTPLRLDEVQIDDPEAGEVLVRVVAAGVCHSDLHFIEGTYPGRFPLILGHEVAGVVEAIGAGVTNVTPGDRVIMGFVQPCGHCRFCDSGRPSLCITPSAARPADRPARRRGGDPVNAMTNIGGFAEYSLTPANGLIKVPAGVSLEIAALVGCSVTTGYGAVVNTAKVEPGSSVAVIGAGGVGLNIIQSARLVGAERIVAIDMVDHKLETARKFGATDTVNASAGDAVEAVRGLIGGGVDYAFEAIGLKATAEQAYKMLGRGGTAVVVGMVPPREEISVSARIWMEEKTLTGSFYGSARFHTDMPRILNLYLQGRLDLDSLVTRRYPLAQINEAFAALKGAEVARSVLTIGAE
ncbi:MAG: Zn-dependent alcohol dehydrogenase [Chloroflexi bacterium]|nr:Zn-dependent alcohol dehydrogenase [Chloroflexota bacterium]MDA1240040.1 Zn-dependent alcohol dehydrogenase [Chloroflexota bacterium]